MPSFIWVPQKKKNSYRKPRPQRIFSGFVLGMNPLYKMKGYALVCMPPVRLSAMGNHMATCSGRTNR